MQTIHYQNREKATWHKIGLKVGAIAALGIALEFLILDADSARDRKADQDSCRQAYGRIPKQ